MRRFRNINRLRQRELTSQFPDLYKLQCVEDTPLYTYGAVSIFDHWLDRDEALALLQNVTATVQEQRNLALHSFSKKIATEFEVLNFKFNGKWKSCHAVFREFTSRNAAHEYLAPATSFSNKDFFKVVIPEIDAVYFESWDDTNVFYLKNPASARILKLLASECGIYYLDKLT